MGTLIAIASEDTSGTRYVSLFEPDQTAAVAFIVQRRPLGSREWTTEQTIPGPRWAWRPQASA